MPSAAIAAQPEKLQEEKLRLEIDALQRQASEEERRLNLELQKLNLEVNALQNQLPHWATGLLGVMATVLSVLGGLLAGILAARVTLQTARANREGELDQAVHEQRLKAYPQLVRSSAPLAIYFPDYEGKLEPRHCLQMGSVMSKWYFEDGGLLLSDESRDAYFALARALTRASKARMLWAPAFPDDAGQITGHTLDEFRKELQIEDPPSVETWAFGGTMSDPATPAQRFRDYVFLRHLSSALRSQLSADIRGRRRTGTG